MPEATWKARYQEWKESGLSKRRWCLENDIQPETFRRWSSRIENQIKSPASRQEDEEENGFYEFLPASAEESGDSHTCLDDRMKPEIGIRFKDYLLYVNPDISKKTLQTVMEVLANA